MKTAGGRNPTFWEWTIVFVALATAIAVSVAAGLSPKWEHAFIYTVLVFAAVLMALRPAWGRVAFWRVLTIIFLLHILAISLVTQALPPDNRGVHGIPLIVIGMAESLLIASILWRVSRRGSSPPAS